MALASAFKRVFCYPDTAHNCFAHGLQCAPGVLKMNSEFAVVCPDSALFPQGGVTSGGSHTPTNLVRAACTSPKFQRVVPSESLWGCGSLPPGFDQRQTVHGLTSSAFARVPAEIKPVCGKLAGDSGFVMLPPFKEKQSSAKGGL